MLYIHLLAFQGDRYDGERILTSTACIFFLFKHLELFLYVIENNPPVKEFLTTDPPEEKYWSDPKPIQQL